MSHRPDRREFLRLSGAAAAASCLPNAGFAAWTPRAARKTKRVVLIAFAGGVRSRETLGAPQNVPALTQMAREGVVYPNVKVANLGHFGAALALFTGVGEAMGIRENARGVFPTLFEYLRSQLGLGAGDVWLSTSGGNQYTNFSYSAHPKFGEAFGANLISGDGVFNADFKALVQDLGVPKALEGEEAAKLDRLRDIIATPGGSAPVVNDPATVRRIEGYIVEELSGKTAQITGPGQSDRKAIRVANNILRLFRPKVLAITLLNADAAHGSYNGYVEIIRKNDEEIGKLLKTIQDDPELRDSTAVIAVPEFGRDKNLNERNGLDHGDGSEDLQRVAAFCWGPDFQRGKIVDKMVSSVDICPTVCELFGAKAEYSKAKVLPQLFES
ncbi:MAG: hypothetical protein JNM84_27800 [Planctomycetes bacterium]|nr:hypothetical protein [Planctomycetota bacterium]